MAPQVNSELPNGWINTSIESLVYLNKKHEVIEDNFDCSFVPMAMVPTKFGKPVDYEERKWKECKKGFTHFKDGDVLLAKITPCFENGKGAVVNGLVNGIGAGSTEYFVLRPIADGIEKTLLHGLLKTREFLSAGEMNMSGSVGHKRVPKEFLMNYNVPLPPLQEQKRIVEKLDSLLSQIETIQQRLNKLPDIIKRFRQSVLAAAVSGKLTEQWRGENKLDKWSKTTIGDTFLTVDGDRGTNYPKKDDYMIEGHCLFLSTKNVRQFGFNFEHKVYISREKHEVLRKGTLERGDLIITTRGTLGHVASYDETVEYPVVRINSGMLILRKLRNDLDNEFFKILFASPSFQKDIEEKRTGSAQPQLPANVLKTFEYLLPTELEQAEIVRLVEQYFTLADTLEKHLAEARARVDNLIQSILAKAFRGELVPQDPNDEPADKLLERIKTARLETEKLEKAAKKAAKVKR